MKTKLILSLLFSQLFYSQINIEEDNLTIEYEKINKASENFGAVTNVRTKSKEIIQYNIKVRVEMLDNKKRLFDPNKFSLIQYKDSIRLRAIDVTFTNLTDKWHFFRLIKDKPSHKSLLNQYNPDIKDTFFDYQFDNIKNAIVPINFLISRGSFRKPTKITHETYYEPKKLRKRNLNLFFPMHKDIENATLYYGNTKIEDITFN